jgi:hypothetical protein
MNPSVIRPRPSMKRSGSDAPRVNTPQVNAYRSPHWSLESSARRGTSASAATGGGGSRGVHEAGGERAGCGVGVASR